MLLSPPDSYRQHVPTKRVLDPCLRVVHKYTCVNAPEATFALEQKGEVFSVGLGLNFQVPSKALLVEEAGRKRIGGRKATDGIPRPLRWTPEFQQYAVARTLPTLAHDRSE